ncbi:unnamed protein product [Phytophthora fragariaefolia]|uniref:Unnamed protein product n=1 Tax=Phytophthora fragariaefolia TaxID=1490495 RepID=A0A9W6Y3W3_9STRA|nr:unnamed protein product [Phytophthora fragariaefolia]
MKVMAEAGGTASARAPLAHLENILHELARCQERKRQQSAASASVNARQKLLSDQLKQGTALSRIVWGRETIADSDPLRPAQEELAAAQASRAKLCEQIGALTQTKAHQAKQLDKYRIDLQASRESQAAMTKKIEVLQQSTWSTKQQYIRPAEQKPPLIVKEPPGLAAIQAKVVSSNREVTSMECHDDVASCNKDQDICQSQKNSEHRDESKSVMEELHNEIAKLKVEYATLNGKLIERLKDIWKTERYLRPIPNALLCQDKHKTLVHDHKKALDDSKTAAQDIEAKQAKIKELTEMLEISRAKQSAGPSDEYASKHDKSGLEARLKVLEVGN